MKAAFFSLLFVFFGTTALYTETAPSPVAPAKEATPQPEEALPMSCDELSQEEQAFSKLLSNGYQKVFCTQLTQTQRKMAMDMNGKVDEQGNVLTADNALIIVAKQFGIALPESPTLPQQSAPQGCPVQ